MSESEPEHDGEEPSEDEDIAEAFFRDTGPNRNEMTASWLPDADHWLVKTFLDRGDAQAIASIHGLIELNPESDLDEKLGPAMEHYYQALVSEDGEGFENYQRAIEAMHGKTSKEDGGTALSLVAADADE